jgi:hypothetical protein
VSGFAAAPPRGRVRLRARRQRALLIASLAWAAAIMHAAASAQPAAEWPPGAEFFAALAVAQLSLSARLWARADTAALGAGAAGAAAVVLWTVTRTAGLPFGPQAGHPQSVGVRDIVAGADELLLAACTVAPMRDRGHLLPPPRRVRAALIAGLLAPTPAGGHSH